MKLTTNQQILVMDWLIEMLDQERAEALMLSAVGVTMPTFDRLNPTWMVIRRWSDAQIENGFEPLHIRLALALETCELTDSDAGAYKAWRAGAKSVKAKKIEPSLEERLKML